MYLADLSLWEAARKQYIFKLKAYMDSYTALVGIQMLGILFSLGGVGSMGMGGNGLDLTFRVFSSDIIFAFTIIWAFTTAITLTTRPYRNQEFTFVGNRLSGSLANILFLLTVSCAAGILSVLSGGLLNVLAALVYDTQVYNMMMSDYADMFGGLLVAVFYIALASALGYLVGSLVQVHKIFIVILLGLFLGLLVQEPYNNGNSYMIDLIAFFGKEELLPLFMIKVVASGAVLFSAATAILNRMEARR